MHRFQPAAMGGGGAHPKQPQRFLAMIILMVRHAGRKTSEQSSSLITLGSSLPPTHSEMVPNLFTGALLPPPPPLSPLMPPARGGGPLRTERWSAPHTGHGTVEPPATAFTPVAPHTPAVELWLPRGGGVTTAILATETSPLK